VPIPNHKEFFAEIIWRHSNVGLLEGLGA